MHGCGHGMGTDTPLTAQKLDLLLPKITEDTRTLGHVRGIALLGILSLLLMWKVKTPTGDVTQRQGSVQRCLYLPQTIQRSNILNTGTKEARFYGI